MLAGHTYSRQETHQWCQNSSLRTPSAWLELRSAQCQCPPRWRPSLLSPGHPFNNSRIDELISHTHSRLHTWMKKNMITIEQLGNYMNCSYCHTSLSRKHRNSDTAAPSLRCASIIPAISASFFTALMAVMQEVGVATFNPLSMPGFNTL